MPYPDSEYPSILRGRDKRDSQRLLAAAPEMLAALKVSVRVMQDALQYLDCPEELALAQAVIAKAEGRSE